MPEFEITAPDGKRFIVTAPDGASQDDVLAYAQKMQSGSTAEEPSVAAQAARGVGIGIRDAMQGVGQLPGMAYDLARMPINLVSSGINAATGANIPMVRSSRENISRVADTIGLPQAETSGEQLRSAIGQNVAGLIPSMGAGAAMQGMTGIPQYVGRALTAAPTSQVMGAVGAGAAGDIARQSDVGPLGQFGAALAGGITGAAVPALAGAAGRGISALVQPFSQTGREKLIGEALLRNSSDPATLPQRLVSGADDEARRLPGSPVTSAVAARDPQMLLLESGLRSDVQTAPGVLSPAATFRDIEAQRDALRLATMDRLQRGGLQDATARGDTVRSGLDAAGEGMRARTDQLFGVARDRSTASVPSGNVLGRAQKALSIFDPKRGGAGVPAELQGVLDDIGSLGTLNLDQAQNIRSRLGKIAGEAAVRGDKPLASAAGSVSTAIEQEVADPRWMAAVAQRSAQGRALGRDMAGSSASASIARKDPFGAPMTTADAAIKKALESPQAARQVLEAGYKGIDDARRAGIPSAEIADSVRVMRQSMRDQFAENLATASGTTGTIANAQGAVTQQLSPAQFTRFWEKNRRIADVLFDGAERRTLDRLAADFAETSVTNTAKARGSDTAQNLSVGNFIARLTNGVIDPQNPLAQSLGNLGPVAGWITKAPEQAMREMMVQALRDPRFAAQLTERAGPASLERALLYWGQTMPERVRDVAAGALVREVPRIGLSEPSTGPRPAPRVGGR
jgi:hypothetical protein